MDLTDVPSDLVDGDDDTQLSEEDVDTMVANNDFVTSSSVAETLSEYVTSSMLSEETSALLTELETLRSRVVALETTATPPTTPLYRLAKGCLVGPGWNHPYTTGDTLTLEATCVTPTLRYHTNYWNCEGTHTSPSPTTCSNTLVAYITTVDP